MGSHFEAAVKGDLVAVMKAEELAAERAVTRGIRRSGRRLRDGLRKATRDAGLAKGGRHRRGGRKNGLAKAWSLQNYPRKGTSLSSVSYVYSKAQRLHSVFIGGATITARKGWLFIPTKAAINMGFHRSSGGKRKNTYNWAMVMTATRFYGSENVTFLRDGDKGVIVAKNAKKSGQIRRTKLRRGQLPTVLFVAVKQVRISKKLNIRRVISSMPDQIIKDILADWDKIKK